jgi:hypothetical protein
LVLVAIDILFSLEKTPVLCLGVVHDQNGWVREAGTCKCALPSYTQKVGTGFLKGS